MSLADTLEFVTRSDPGRVRARNEDAVFADPAQGLAILADGMGGHNAGDVASQMAIDALSSSFAVVPGSAAPQPTDCGQRLINDQIESHIAAANLAILDAGQRRPDCAGMGTTLVLAWFHNNRLYVAHVGGSRLYRWRDGALRQLTRDHSLLRQMIDHGLVSAANASRSPIKNLVTRALGIDAWVEPEINNFEVRPGDIYLLCSDGLSDMVADDEIAHTLGSFKDTLPGAAEKLVDIANNHGGRDNVSIILIKVRGEFAAPRHWWQKPSPCAKS